MPNQEKPENTGSKQGEVGNKRPPKEYQFKPGVSGNPKGKPKGALSLTAAIKRRLRYLTPDGKRDAMEMLADNIIQDALDSSDKMRTLIWNYLDGLPQSKVDITSGGEKIPIWGKYEEKDLSTEAVDETTPRGEEEVEGGSSSQESR